MTTLCARCARKACLQIRMPGRHSSVDALRCRDSSTRPRPQGTICYPLDVKVAMDRVPELLTIAFSTTCYSLRESSVCRAPCLNRSESACAAEVGSPRPACSEVSDGCSCRKSCVAFQRSTWSRSISSTSIRMARPAAATSSRASRVRPSPQRQSVSSFSSSRTAWRDVSVRVLLGLLPERRTLRDLPIPRVLTARSSPI